MRMATRIFLYFNKHPDNQLRFILQTRWHKFSLDYLMREPDLRRRRRRHKYRHSEFLSRN